MEKLAHLIIGIVLCVASGCTVGPVLESTKDPSSVTAVSSETNVDSALKSSNLVYFEYDKYNLDSSSVSEIRKVAKTLNSNISLKLRIEGHCDERGTREYNLALGERRANAVMELLVISGVSSNRLTTVSYGEEKPINQASNESAWSENRRAVLKIF